MRCAFTGHRPQRLPWGSAEEDPRCLALKYMIEKTVHEAAALGCSEFVCGMALGCDFWFAEAVLKKGYPLIAMLPCPNQSVYWSKPQQERYQELLSQCSEVYVLEDSYSDGCMLRRNRTMIDRANVLITVYDGGSGGTASAVQYALSKGKRILPIWR
ncbi:MAG: DUF1273 family protein [Oscillospiraceae bacterium]|nr:DUF1273 family protein [Oscillospiraceae bacterium]